MSSCSEYQVRILDFSHASTLFSCHCDCCRRCWYIRTHFTRKTNIFSSFVWVLCSKKLMALFAFSSLKWARKKILWLWCIIFIMNSLGDKFRVGCKSFKAVKTFLFIYFVFSPAAASLWTSPKNNKTKQNNKWLNITENKSQPNWKKKTFEKKNMLLMCLATANP